MLTKSVAVSKVRYAHQIRWHAKNSRKHWTSKNIPKQQQLKQQCERNEWEKKTKNCGKLRICFRGMNGFTVQYILCTHIHTHAKPEEITTETYINYTVKPMLNTHRRHTTFWYVYKSMLSIWESFFSSPRCLLFLFSSETVNGAEKVATI